MDKNKIGFVYSEVYFNQQWTAKLEKWFHHFIPIGTHKHLKLFRKFNLPSMKNKTFFYRYENEIVFSTSFESPC